MNGYDLQASHDEWIDIALKIASPEQGRTSVSDLAGWVQVRLSPITL